MRFLFGMKKKKVKPATISEPEKIKDGTLVSA
jgi:hypothetical protein